MNEGAWYGVTNAITRFDNAAPQFALRIAFRDKIPLRNSVEIEQEYLRARVSLENTIQNAIKDVNK